MNTLYIHKECKKYDAHIQAPAYVDYSNAIFTLYIHMYLEFLDAQKKRGKPSRSPHFKITLNSPTPYSFKKELSTWKRSPFTRRCDTNWKWSGLGKSVNFCLMNLEVLHHDGEGGGLGDQNLPMGWPPDSSRLMRTSLAPNGSNLAMPDHMDARYCTSRKYTVSATITYARDYKSHTFVKNRLYLSPFKLKYLAWI